MTDVASLAFAAWRAKLASKETPEPIHKIEKSYPQETAPNVIYAPVPITRPYAVFRKYPMAQDIIRIVCHFYGDIPLSEILSHRKDAAAVRCRQICMYLIKELTTLSYPMIARAMEKRDHTTIMHGYRKISILQTQDERLRDELDILKIKVGELMAARNAAVLDRSDADC